MKKSIYDFALTSGLLMLSACTNKPSTYPQCTVDDSHKFEEYSLAPNGLYIIQRDSYEHLTAQEKKRKNQNTSLDESSSKSDMNKTKAVIPRRHKYSVRNTHGYFNDGSAESQHHFSAICYAKCYGYFWTAKSALIYKDINTKFQWFTYDPVEDILHAGTEPPYNQRDTQLYDQLQHTPKKIFFDSTFTAGVLMTTWFGWQVNEYGEQVLRLSWTSDVNDDSDQNARGGWMSNWAHLNGMRRTALPPDEYDHVQLAQSRGNPARNWIRNKVGQYVKHPQKMEGKTVIRDITIYKEIFQYNRDTNNARLIVSSKFRTAKRRAEQPIAGDDGIDYFYFLTNEGRDYTTLIRYVDAISDGVMNEVFKFDRANIEYISSNRDGTDLYWAYSDRTAPDYHFFSDEAKTLFDLIDMDAPHRSEIISMDNAGNMAIIKRQSGKNIIDYILVNTQQQATHLLLSCQDE